MKYLILSDTHLSDFDTKTFDYLYALISKYDRIIIAGDFWEGYKMDFSKFLKSDWNKLFKILKEKHAIYTPGNHDDFSDMDSRVSQFCDIYQAIYEINLDGKKLHIEHGHKYLISPDIKYHVNIFPRFIQFIIFKLSGYEKKQKKLANAYIEELAQTGTVKPGVNNFKIVNFIPKDSDLFIFGHTHIPQDSEAFKFVNSGFINNGYSSYITIDDHTKEITLHMESY